MIKENRNSDLTQFFILLPALLTPYIFYTTIPFEFIYSKQLWLYFSSILICPFLIFNFFKERDVSRLDIIILIFLILLFLQSYILKTGVTQNSKLQNFLASGIVYFYIRQNSHKKIFVIGFISFFVVTVTFLIFLGFMQILGYRITLENSQMITGTFFHSAPFAGFLSVFFPLFLNYILNNLFLRSSENNHFFKKIILFLSVFSFVGTIILLPFLKSRAAFLAIIVGSSFVLIRYCVNMQFDFLNFFKKKHIKNLTKYLIVFSSILLLFYVYGIRQDSANGRLLVWKIAFNMVKDKPLIGHGFDLFKTNYSNYQIEYFRLGNIQKYERFLSGEPPAVYNEFLQILTETGIIGFGIFISILYFVIKTNNKKTLRNNTLFIDTIGPVASLISFITFAFFSYPFSLAELTLVFFILLAFSSTDSLQILSKKANVLKVIVFIGLVTVFLILIKDIKVNINRFKNYQYWYLASNESNLVLANTLLSKCFPELEDNDYFLFQYANNLFKMRKYEQSINIANMIKDKGYEELILLGNAHFNLKDFPKSKMFFENAHFFMPHKFIPLNRLLEISLKLNDNSSVLNYAKEIVNMDVKVSSYEVYTIKRKALYELNKRKNIIIP